MQKAFQNLYPGLVKQSIKVFARALGTYGNNGLSEQPVIFNGSWQQGPQNNFNNYFANQTNYWPTQFKDFHTKNEVYLDLQENPVDLEQEIAPASSVEEVQHLTRNSTKKASPPKLNLAILTSHLTENLAVPRFLSIKQPSNAELQYLMQIYYSNNQFLVNGQQITDSSQPNKHGIKNIRLQTDREPKESKMANTVTISHKKEVVQIDVLALLRANENYKDITDEELKALFSLYTPKTVTKTIEKLTFLKAFMSLKLDSKVRNTQLGYEKTEFLNRYNTNQHQLNLTVDKLEALKEEQIAKQALGTSAPPQAQEVTPITFLQDREKKVVLPPPVMGTPQELNISIKLSPAKKTPLSPLTGASINKLIETIIEAPASYIENPKTTQKVALKSLPVVNAQIINPESNQVDVTVLPPKTSIERQRMLLKAHQKVTVSSSNFQPKSLLQKDSSRATMKVSLNGEEYFASVSYSCTPNKEIKLRTCVISYLKKTGEIYHKELNKQEIQQLSNYAPLLLSSNKEALSLYTPPILTNSTKGLSVSALIRNEIIKLPNQTASILNIQEAFSQELTNVPNQYKTSPRSIMQSHTQISHAKMMALAKKIAKYMPIKKETQTRELLNQNIQRVGVKTLPYSSTSIPTQKTKNLSVCPIRYKVNSLPYRVLNIPQRESNQHRLIQTLPDQGTNKKRPAAYLPWFQESYNQSIGYTDNSINIAPLNATNSSYLIDLNQLLDLKSISTNDFIFNYQFHIYLTLFLLIIKENTKRNTPLQRLSLHSNSGNIEISFNHILYIKENFFHMDKQRLSALSKQFKQQTNRLTDLVEEQRQVQPVPSYSAEGLDSASSHSSPKTQRPTKKATIPKAHLNGPVNKNRRKKVSSPHTTFFPSPPVSPIRDNEIAVTISGTPDDETQPKQSVAPSFYEPASIDKISIFATLDKGLNGNNFEPAYSLETLFKDISNPLISIMYPKAIELTSKLSQKLQTKGIEVTSPSGISYNLLKPKNQSTMATLTKANAQNLAGETQEQHQQRLAITVMNMIDNIAANSVTINIETSDPFIAEIAEQYINFLENSDIQFESKNIKCHSNEDAETSKAKTSAADLFQKLTAQETNQLQWQESEATKAMQAFRTEKVTHSYTM